MKGISIAINSLVLIAVAMLVLIAILYFFTGNVTGTMSQMEANRVFLVGCEEYCGVNEGNSYSQAYTLCTNKNNDFARNFTAACVLLNYMTPDTQDEMCFRCLQGCGSCDMSVNSNTGQFKNNIVNIASKGIDDLR